MTREGVPAARRSLASITEQLEHLELRRISSSARAIEAALLTLEVGSYGVCLSCAEPILPRRLLDRRDGVPPSASFRLQGPGIKPGVEQAPEMPGLFRDELRLLGEVNGAFPLGVDAFFLDRESVMAVPRSVSLREA